MRRSDTNCFLSALAWLIGNAAFGLAPLLFLMGANLILEQNDTTNHEIDILLKGGIILFVCCALMGAVIIEILLSKIIFRRFSFFAVNVSPFILLFIISVIYLLTILEKVSKSVFTSPSKFYIFVIVFTIIYCTLGKYLLYKHEAKNSR